MPFEYETLRAKTQQTLVEFLNAELNLGSTFVRSAENARDAGHLDHFSQTKSNAIRAAETVRRFMSTVTDGKIRNEIDRRLADLDRLISTL